MNASMSTPPAYKLGTVKTVVTGEAVSLDLPSVSLITRGAALLVDLIIYWAALLILFFLLGINAGAFGYFDPAMAAAVSLATVVLCLVAVPVTIETLTRGRSVGKLAFGIRVVRDDGGTIRFRHSFIRGLAGFGEFYLTLGLMPLLAAIFNPRGKRMGDIMAGTYAIKARHPRVRPMMLPVPGPLAAWAQIADIGRIPDTTAAQAARLLRTVERGGTSIDRPAVLQVADRLADEIYGYIAPAPPPTGSLDFLSAVMAERRNREYQRMVQQQSRQLSLQQRLHALPYS